MSEMNAKVLGHVKLDRERLSKELAMVDSEFPFNISYNRYARGNPGWKNCVLRNESGEYLDTSFKGSYEGNGLLMPHRDYLDIEDDDFTRIHIVLQTDIGARHSEEEKCYHMRQGEVWFVDGKYVHCAQAFSDRPRMNCVMDFEPGIPFEELFKDKAAYDPNIEPHWVDREPFTDDDLNRIIGLGDIASVENWTDISSIVGKVHFQKEVSVSHTYDWLNQIAVRSGNQELIDRSIEMKKFFIGE